MSETDTPGNFFKENKKLVREYIETRLEIYKLRLFRIFWKSAGYLVWMTILLFLLSILLVFLGLLAGFWLSDVTGSHIKGFGLATFVIVILIFVLAAWRKVLFVNPVIRNLIKKAGERTETEDE